MNNLFRCLSVGKPAEIAYTVYADSMECWDAFRHCRSRCLSPWTCAYATYGDGLVQHAPDSPVVPELVEDWLASVATYLIDHPEDVAILAKHWGDAIRPARLAFYAGVKHKEGKRQWFSSRDLKVSASDAKRHDKRWEEVPEWADGSLKSIVGLMRLGNDVLDGLLEALRRYHQVKDWLEQQEERYWCLNIAEQLNIPGADVDKAYRALDSLVMACVAQRAAGIHLENWRRRVEVKAAVSA